MKAIEIKYLSATNTLGVRVKAITDAGSMIEARDYAVNFDEQARRLANKYASEKFNSSVVGFGCLKNGDYVATLSAI